MIIERVKLNPTEKNKENCLELSFDYNLGNCNYYTGKENSRGYYLYCTPIEKKDGMNAFILGRGRKMLLKKVNRKSKKAEAEAMEIAKANKQMVIDEVVKAYGLELSN